MGRKHVKRMTFNPPTRYPGGNVNEIMLMQKIKQTYDKELNDASNNSFNLALSAALIASRDMGMSCRQTKEMLQRTFGILDDVADGLSRIEEMLKLVESWGITIYDTAQERTTRSSKTIEQKTAVFYLLQEGTTEIEDIITKCKLHSIDIDYRDACAYRWEFNRKKYYADMEADMSKKDEAFRLFDKGLQNTDVVEQLGVTRGTASQYRYLWNLEQGDDHTMAKNKERALEMIKNGADKDELVKKLGITEAAAIRFLDQYREDKTGGEIEIMTEKMKKAFELFDKAYADGQVAESIGTDKETVKGYRKEWIKVSIRDLQLSTEEMAGILAGEDGTAVILRKKGVIPEKKVEKNEKAKKHFEARNSMDEVKQEVKAEEKVVAEEKPVKADQAVSIQDEQGCKYEYREMSNGLKKKVKVVEVAEAIEGEFATYTPVTGSTFDVEVDGQVLTLDRNAMKTLGKELLAVAEEEI